MQKYTLQVLQSHSLANVTYCLYTLRHVAQFDNFSFDHWDAAFGREGFGPVLHDAVKEPTNQAQHAFVPTIALPLWLQFLQLTIFLKQYHGSENSELCAAIAASHVHY